MEAHVAVTVAAKPTLVQISTAYKPVAEGSPILPRQKYVAIREDKPKDKEQAKWPQFKTCKYTAEAIAAEGEDRTLCRRCAPIPPARCITPKRKQPTTSVADNVKWKAEQEKQRKERAVSEATGVRVLSAISAAVPVRLMKRDLLFVSERLAALVDDNRLALVAKHHGITKAIDKDSIPKLFGAFLRRSEESVLGRIVVELTIVLAASHSNAPAVLKDGAAVYKMDTDAIVAKVK